MDPITTIMEEQEYKNLNSEAQNPAVSCGVFSHMKVVFVSCAYAVVSIATEVLAAVCTVALSL